jgi:hypothetical protein
LALGKKARVFAPGECFQVSLILARKKGAYLSVTPYCPQPFLSLGLLKKSARAFVPSELLR